MDEILNAHRAKQPSTFESLMGAATDPQFYRDMGSRVFDALSNGVRDVFPTGAKPGSSLAQRGVPVDPEYNRKILNLGLAGMTMGKAIAVEPDALLEGRQLIEIHSANNASKLKAITENMAANGWQGRPILAWDTGNGSLALTGSHRIAAARAAGIEVPTVYVDAAKMEKYAAKTGKTVDDIIGAGDDHVHEMLRAAGDKRAAYLMGLE
jgi:hypothetical protein